MSKKHSFLLLLFAVLFSRSYGQQEDLTRYVNPLMGTLSEPSLSNGNTYPAISTPWAMNMWTPQTGANGNGWQYRYTENKIQGFKETHQPSPWMNDYGVFSIMPVSGKAVVDQKGRASWFSHKAEVSEPGYYSVYLADYNISTEIAPTERAAIFRVNYKSKDSAFLVVDAFHKGSHIEIIPGENKIVGYSKFYARGRYENFANYFVLEFNKPFNLTKAWQDEKIIDSLSSTGGHSGAIVGIDFKGDDRELIVKTSSSFISLEQAELNLQREVGSKSFDDVRTQTRKAWNDVLSKIEIEGGTIDQKRTFYSCFYRAVLFPNKLYEINAKGDIVHWSPYNGKILPGYMYGGTGFWDTFRALYPFLNLMYPSINKEMQEGLLNDYKEGGYLPEWSSPGYANIMVGNNSASVVADAYLKDAKVSDINMLYEALMKDANNEGPIEAVGRHGVKYYNALGYVPYNIGINENVARTLEYAYDDFAILKLAQQLKRPKVEIELLAQRCLNYRNVFDPRHKLMRGKNRDGSFQRPFNPLKWGDAFTEGNSWHYTWSVFHDINNLANLMGGKKELEKMLDSVFAMPPVFDDSYYGGTIHEIREMQIADMGQYAHGNQPIQHMIYLFDYAGAPYKTQHWVREVMNRLYKATPDGYCGDEDNGQTSAWYLFSAMGFYPVCPATDQYILGAPLFPKMTLHLENGKDFIIDAKGNSDSNRYVAAQQLNGKNYSPTWISYESIRKGGNFVLDMSATPNTSRTMTAADYPYSFSKDETALYNTVKDRALPGRDALGLKPTETIKRKKLTLLFDDPDSLFSSEYKQWFVDTYFEQYPILRKKFNKHSPDTVRFFVNREYDGVAATYNRNIIVFNPEWFKKNPEDIDVITHELMHVVQAYHYDKVPGWVTEGIADYVRAVYGVNNIKAKWSLTDLQPKHNYDNAYRITGRFLLWITQHYDKDFVLKLNMAAREKTYTDGFWKEQTGKTVQELWAEYIANPEVKIDYR